VTDQNQPSAEQVAYRQLGRAQQELSELRSHISMLKTLMSKLNPDLLDPIHDIEERIAKLELLKTALENGIRKFKSEHPELTWAG
jgi:hypothetical protein